jgi:uncharacterized protein with GYD domain
MAKFATALEWTPASWARMINNPDDRNIVAEEMCEAFGGTLDSIYWLPLAPYNMLIITDMPDTITAAAITFAIMSKGAEVRAATYQLLTQEQFSDALQLAADARKIYRPPGEHD